MIKKMYAPELPMKPTFQNFISFAFLKRYMAKHHISI